MYRVRWEKQKNDDKFWPFQTKRAEFELLIEIAQFFLFHLPLFWSGRSNQVTSWSHFARFVGWRAVLML